MESIPLLEVLFHSTVIVVSLVLVAMVLIKNRKKS